MPLLPTISMPMPGKTEAAPLLLRIDLPSGDGRSGRAESEPGDRRARQAEAPLICAHCSAPITSRDQAIEINGRHEHAFFNPAGIAYEIRCFRRAPGCLIQGDPTSEFTWFAGYRWQFSLCATCLTHLGWFFSSRQDTPFYGLIRNRLL